VDNYAQPLDAGFRRALALHQESRLEEAALAYEEVLRRQPRHLQALTFLSTIAFARQDMERTLELTAKALEVDLYNPAIYLIRGHVQSSRRQHQAAAASYERATALKPDLVDAHLYRGNALGELGLHLAAIESYDAALRLDPARAELHASRGLALYELRRYQECLEAFDAALALAPNFAEVHLSAALALKDLLKFDRALARLDRALEIRPDYALAHVNRGAVLSALERSDEALASYEAALAIDPCNLDALCNRGNLLGAAHRHEEALASFDRALAIRHDYPHAHFCKSLVCLVRGDWETGWGEFEWRFKSPHCATSREVRNFGRPQWRGEPIAGKTILLHCEQGLGDTLQFCRFAKNVAELGAHVLFESPAALATLLHGLSGVAELFVRGQDLPPFDFHCPLLSLPPALNTTVATVPADVPYLVADAGRRARWRARLGARTKPRVGLVWSGGFRPDQPELWVVNTRRNIPLAELAPLRHPGIEYISLQKGREAEAELAEAIASGWDGPKLASFTDEIQDFADTAALITELDLVISVDTSVAHLAGALGRPVWILNRFDTCWRWLLERRDTPWYPTALLYRQTRSGDWSEVIRRVRADLEPLTSPA
jgi:tetratricopeptide (TPR) repeat protein